MSQISVVMGSSIINCILDGLEKVVEEVLQFKNMHIKKLVSLEKLKTFKGSSKINPFKSCRMLLKFLFLRVGGHILILGKSVTTVFDSVLSVLQKKLNEKKLVVKNLD